MQTALRKWHTLKVLEGCVGDNVDGRTYDSVGIKEDVGDEGLQPPLGHLAVRV